MVDLPRLHLERHGYGSKTKPWGTTGFGPVFPFTNRVLLVFVSFFLGGSLCFFGVCFGGSFFWGSFVCYCFLSLGW